jgi:RNA polymerase sigma-70 factor (ECF subfamily)
MTASTTLREVIERELPKLYTFAFQMCCDRQEAERFIGELIVQINGTDPAFLLEASDPFEALLGVLSRNLDDALGRRSDHTFESLDSILRSDLTRPIDLNKAVFADDQRKIHLMLWQLKRTCLTSVLTCLPPGVRLSFVLTDLWGISPARASIILDIKETAYRVRLTRARKRLEDYLTPRCAHVDSQNPCTCTGRLVIAMEADFVAMPLHELDIPHEPHDLEGPRRDVASLYRSLPPVQMTPEAAARLLNLI